MNAPLPQHVRRAIETVTPGDNPRSGLHHKDTAGGAAARGGFGVEPFAQGGAL